MSAGRQKRSQEIGITHFPLDDEQQSQKRVPSRKTNSRTNQGGGGTHGHRLSRESQPGITFDPESFSGKGGKGGKTKGSRAGFLSSNKKVARGSR
jgi:hypothetical protein